MVNKKHIFLTVLLAGMALAAGAEPSEDMRVMARMLALLEARNLNGYCREMQSAPYADYLGRVCQYAARLKLKKPEECTSESVHREANAEVAKCMAMPADEFENKIILGEKAAKEFIAQMREQGVDVETLMQQERAKIR